ncbi:endolytic transglycosylase MltG [Luteibacter flocculans]|uniref:Endolytic murein transglycosylase n=1 Tax=Luteibacter flocculans TaxID=2780091 RepID=A0ABY4SY45_9GAMM|nr:endolytic transglycosylase MltG [Luteibacter flocculans]URL57215.1 endolytic transglycosylase MltG [Luteibacter flocculans]
MKARGIALWRVILLVLLLAAIAAGSWLWFDWARFARSPLTVAGTGQSIDVARGASFKDIVRDLRNRKASQASPLYWRLLVMQMHASGRLHAGEYALRPGMSPRDLIADMAAGKVMQRNFTIVDGWTVADLRRALAAVDTLTHDTADLDDAALMKRMGAEDEHPEGRFLPETYAYVKGDPDSAILKRAYVAMSRTLDEAWKNRAPDLPLATPYEALILASIVEKETGRADERPRIAGVFVRRLQQHILLQTDPTVIYGMGAAYVGNIHKSDLTADTPYNTYTRAGLPPTPIALPGRAAIEAALHPAAGSELYFVARGDGSHVFSSTLEEHNRAVACYQLKRCK